MRIAIIGPVYPFRGGIAHFNGHLAHHLRLDGHTVKVTSFKRQYPSWLYPGETDRDTSGKPITTDASFILDYAQPWTWYTCSKNIHAWKPDLVLIAWWTTFWWVGFAVIAASLRSKGINTAFLVHNITPHEAHWWDKLFTWITLHQTDKFLVQSENQKQRLLELYSNAKFVNCPHPIYNMFPNQQIDKKIARQTLGIRTDVTTLLFFGIVRPYKGLINLLQSLRILKDQGQNLQLVVAGEFWESLEEYQGLIKLLDLEEDVSIVAKYIPDENIPLFFSASDLLVAPYIGGTQSGVAKLAIGYPLPVLITENIADELLRSYSDEGVTISPNAEPANLANSILSALHSDGRLSAVEHSPAESWKAFTQAVISLCNTQD